MATREEMNAVLKATCVAFLRTKGFKGSFPNLYRDIGGFIALVNFQFFSSGGSFCVNLSYAGPNGENVYFKPDTPARKLSVSQTRERERLGAAKEDRWFSFGETSYGKYRGKTETPDAIADLVKGLFESHAEPWWESKSRQYVCLQDR
jgi:uncharacterized protein DUF4304